MSYEGFLFTQVDKARMPYGEESSVRLRLQYEVTFFVCHIDKSFPFPHEHSNCIIVSEVASAVQGRFFTMFVGQPTDGCFVAAPLDCITSFPVNTWNFLPRHDPVVVIFFPRGARARHHTRLAEHGRQIFADVYLDNAGAKRLRIDEVHSIGEFELPVGAVDIRIDGKVRVGCQVVP